jgi:hypothetical protein
MVVKQGSGWGYETLVREVSDSLQPRGTGVYRTSSRAPSDLYRIGRDWNDGRVGQLVVPGLLLGVPEHPQVPEHEEPGQEGTHQASDHRPPDRHRPRALEVDHANTERPLTEGLAARLSLQVAEVQDRDSRVEDEDDQTEQDARDSGGRLGRGARDGGDDRADDDDDDELGNDDDAEIDSEGRCP